MYPGLDRNQKLKDPAKPEKSRTLEGFEKQVSYSLHNAHRSALAKGCNGIQGPFRNVLPAHGVLVEQQIIVLKDDSWKISVLSKEFVRRNRQFLRCRQGNYVVIDSDRDYTETSSEIVNDAEVHMGSRKYRPKWIVAICGRNMILCMQWHKDTNLNIDNVESLVSVSRKILPIKTSHASSVKISNMRVKKAGSMLKKKKRSSE